MNINFAKFHKFSLIFFIKLYKLKLINNIIKKINYLYYKNNYIYKKLYKKIVLFNYFVNEI